MTPKDPVVIGGLSRSERRLADELDEDGIRLPAHDTAAAMVIQELDYARHTPMFEGRRHPIYGSVITPEPDALLDWSGAHVEIVDAGCDLADARTYADGRSSFLLRDPARPDRIALACFDRLMQYEADLVRLQQDTGCLIVQRTPVLAVSRLFQHDQVVAWNGGSWDTRTTACGARGSLLRAVPDLDETVIDGILTFAIHWLAPIRAGATLVVADDIPPAALDVTGTTTGPRLDITNRTHYPPLLSCLMQRDLATIIDAAGTIQAYGVGLRTSGTGTDDEGDSGGMRHRSARAWSDDHPTATIIVVSADGPVTVYRAGTVLDGAS